MQTRVIFTISYLILIVFPAFAAKISGKISNSSSSNAIIFANVALYQGNEDAIIKGTSADMNGWYELTDIKAGSYRIVFSAVGYENYIQQIEILKNDDFILNVGMREAYEDGKEVIIVEQIEPNTLNEVLLSKSPAVYDDPARAFLQKFSLVNTNDQANNISVRGNSPNGLKWFLNGVEIPNPNHTPNAGTERDRVTYSGGGVNMLKPEFIGAIRFSYHDFNNSLGGQILTEVQSEYEKKTAIKLGLIGLEAMHSQPFKNGNVFASFRYSTFGLLTDVIGLDFGGEKINYLDYNISANWKSEQLGNFQLFSIYGTSKNHFETQRDTSLWEEQKDRFDIRFNSASTIHGVSNTFTNNDNSLKTTVAYASWNTTRTAERLSNDFSTTLVENDSLRHKRLSFFSEFKNQKNNKDFTARLHGYYGTYALSNFDSLWNYPSSGTISSLTLEPSIAYAFTFGKLKTGVELGALYFGHTNEWSLQPRFYLKKEAARANNFAFHYALRSQNQNPEVYLSRNSTNQLINSQIGFSKAHHLDMTYSRNLQKGSFTALVYYQSLYDIPIIDKINSTFSVLNEFQAFVTDTLTNAGSGKNYGIELAYEYKKDDFYLSANGALYQSTYTGGDGIERNTRFNGNFIFNAIVGKEWYTDILKAKSEVDKKIGVYLRGLYAGGLRETPIDENLSAQFGRTVYQDNQAFSLSQGNIFKIDARLYWEKSTKNREGITTKKHTIAFDIQNLTNQKNVGFRYYDTIQGQIATKYQLGLIPLLSWKVEF
jgi:hypothetical protein